MSLEYALDEKDDFVVVTACGTLSSLEQLMEFVGSLTEDVLKQGARKVLVDNRKVDSADLSFFDKYEFASNVAGSSVQRTIKWALVSPPERASSLKDFETLLRNRGYTFWGFETLQAAIEWLKD